jgi:hypothetical protein
MELYIGKNVYIPTEDDYYVVYYINKEENHIRLVNYRTKDFFWIRLDLFRQLIELSKEEAYGTGE